MIDRIMNFRCAFRQLCVASVLLSSAILLHPAAPAPMLNIPAVFREGMWVPNVPQPVVPGPMDYIRNMGNATGNAALAPFALLGSVAGITYKGAGMAVGAAGSVLSLAAAHPLPAAGFAAYGLLADNGQGLNAVKGFLSTLGKKAHENGFDRVAGALHNGALNVAGTVGVDACNHLNRNAKLAGAIIAPLIIIKAWDAVLGKNGSLVLDGIFKEMLVVPSDGKTGLPLANFMFDIAPDATTLYHQLLDGDATLRPALLLAIRKGSVNNWKIGVGDPQQELLAQIDLELARSKAMQARVEFYGPNVSDMLKEARKCAGLMTNQRHYSTEEKEAKYWEMILEWMKDPRHAKAKPNTWMVPIQKSVEGVITSFEFKMPNIFWHIYPYYGQALLLYASLEQRKERLIALRELVEHELPQWLKEDAELRG